MTSDGQDEKGVEEARDEAYERLWHMSAQLVHDIRTPLLANILGSSTLQPHLSSLLEGYRKAAEQGLVDKKERVPPTALRGFADVADRLLKQSQKGQDLVSDYWTEVKESLPPPKVPWRGDG